MICYDKGEKEGQMKLLELLARTKLKE